MIDFTREIHGEARITPAEEKSLGSKTQEFVEQWPYCLYILVENKHLDIKLKFELPTPCGVELRRPRRQMFRIVIQGCY